MDQQVNERWLQFAFLNAKGKINKTALKFPFHAGLEVDQEFVINILDRPYTFVCVSKEKVSNHGDTVDMVYVVATPNS